MQRTTGLEGAIEVERLGNGDGEFSIGTTWVEAPRRGAGFIRILWITRTRRIIVITGNNFLIFSTSGFAFFAFFIDEFREGNLHAGKGDPLSGHAPCPGGEVVFAETHGIGGIKERFDGFDETIGEIEGELVFAGLAIIGVGVSGRMGTAHTDKSNIAPGIAGEETGLGIELDPILHDTTGNTTVGIAITGTVHADPTDIIIPNPAAKVDGTVDEFRAGELRLGRIVNGFLGSVRIGDLAILDVGVFFDIVDTEGGTTLDVGAEVHGSGIRHGSCHLPLRAWTFFGKGHGVVSP